MKTRASKRKRLPKEENKSNEKSIDKISNLPDDILHHIFSHLPFKSIVQTGVLSKRWSQVWVSCPVLEFSCPPTDNFHAKKVEFINRVLSRRHGNSYVELFKVEGLLASSSLYDFISRLVKHRVENLVLHVSLSDSFSLPPCVFECDSLRGLTLNSHSQMYSHPIYGNGWFCFSPQVTNPLRSLHTLSLIRVSISEDSFSSSSFPSLEKLTIGMCQEMNHLNISCQGLKDVHIFQMEVNSLEISGMRLENLEVEKVVNKAYNGSSVDIFAPNLQTFWWRFSDMYEECLLQSFPALRTSGIIPPNISMKEIDSAVNLLSGSSQVQELWLSPDYLKIFSTIYFQGGLPYSFVNLETLGIGTRFNRSEIPGIACLFMSSPRIHTLIVDEIFDRSKQDRWNNALLDNSHCTEEQYWKSQAQALGPFLCNLKVVKVYVPSRMHEGLINFARFLLEHGRALQKIILDSLANTEKRSLWEDKVGFLEGLPRASTDVKISVV